MYYFINISIYLSIYEQIFLSIHIFSQIYLSILSFIYIYSFIYLFINRIHNVFMMFYLLSYQYSKLFDPRVERAALSPGSSSSSAQAEYVTGTHLYAYLMDETSATTAG